MDEIFLNDYNNVAMAQDPIGIAGIQAQPGFDNYQPSFLNQGLAPDKTNLPDLKQVAKTIAENQMKNYVTKKLGLEGIKGNVLSSVLGTNPYLTGIATIGSTLTGNSLNISNLLAQKRAEKMYNSQNRAEIQDIQKRLDSTTPSNQDNNRGDGAQTKTTSTQKTQERQTAGTGGLHSGY